MNIIDYIPYGQENGVSMDYLCKVTGLDNRGVRNELEKARAEQAVLNLQDGKGYFLPLPDETFLIEKWIRQEESRAKAIRKGLKGARKQVKNERM